MKEEGGEACRARYSVGGIGEEIDSAALGSRACMPFPLNLEVCLGFLVF